MSKAAGIIERTFQATAGLLTLSFLGSGIVFLWIGHATVTVFDMWQIYDSLLNQPFLRAVLSKYGNHSIFLPNLLWLFDIAVFHNNQQFLFLIGLALLVSSAILLSTPIWRDNTIGTTAKLLATLVVVVGTFWMGRASITSIGAFNCICALTIVAAVVAFHGLAMMCDKTRPFRTAGILLVTSGLVSSFSFGSGFAVWPTLLFLGWSARLSWRKLSIILVAGIVAAIVYKVLPGPAPEIAPQDAITVITALSRLCRLLGTPFLYAATAWSSHALSSAAAQSSRIPVICGGLGVALTVAAAVPRLVRRDLGRSKLQLFALALTLFNFVAMIFIVIGRTAHMHSHPSEILAPRYVFWSSLFWTGLFLILIQNVDSKKLTRWPAFVLLLSLPILTFPQHYRAAVWARQLQLLTESAATSLINGVCDRDKVKILNPDPARVYRVAKQFRNQRLDMFADGLQDWIGAPQTKLFAGRYKPVDLKGGITIASLVSCENGAPAARVTGWAFEEGNRIPKKLVFLDPAGTICGIARPTERRADYNRRFKLSKFAASGFLGYIRDYDPHTAYRARSVDHDELSQEDIVVAPP